ncbi:hypothetical protein BN938_2923 [Mucinivorans hirudinis]|uniref:PD-(D/E)XK endonuclease-like domain-containing protein n=1 Tax=Mucinivorans hirudinis TaxID=1433126 RepID=A0A060RED6_9BACT|nr:hypothetical protein BN938_2923 [Mucinivorans hirudinis]
MRKIIFNPQYDTKCFIDYKRRGGTILDTQFVGKQGLLSELELRAGLTIAQIPTIERKASYLVALEEYISDNQNSMFRKSVQVDSFGVADELLSWRDRLVFAGWNGSITGISEKLDELSAIESHFSTIGDEDRWQRVLVEYSTKPILSNTTIEVHSEKEHLNPIYRHLLDTLSTQGVQIDYFTPQISKPKITVVEFDDLYDAYRWGATMPKEYLMICQNRKAFNNILSSYSEPTISSTLNDSNPSIIQLFKLGLSLFMRPLNIYNLLSYLQVAVNPVPSALRSELKSLLVDEGGFGDQEKGWNAIITNYIASLDLDKRKRNEGRIEDFLSMLSLNEAEIDRKRVLEYAKKLGSWALQRKAIEVDSSINEQLSLLSTFCNAMTKLLTNSKQEKISQQELKMLILAIYAPSSFVGSEAQKGSFNSVNSIENIADSVPKAIWIDCNGSLPVECDYSFLSKQEAQKLKESRVLIWDTTAQLQAAMAGIEYALGQIDEEIILVSSQNHNGEQLSQHPIITKYRKDDVASNPVPNCKSEQKPVTPLPSPQEKYQFAGKVSPRVKESFSSLDMLIKYPLDYALKYLAGLYKRGVAQLGQLERTKGNVAHRVIENLAKECDNNAYQMLQSYADNSDKCVEVATNQVGVILLLEENRIDFENFKRNLKEAVFALCGIIETNNLDIVSLESKLATLMIDEVILDSRMDMLLKNKSGEYIVFDLKWSSGKKQYEQIQDNSALQLAVYQYLCERNLGKVAAVGFYILPKTQLYTAHRNFVNTERRITVIEPKEEFDLMLQAMDSYKTRYEELGSGLAIVGEQNIYSDYQLFKAEVR